MEVSLDYRRGTTTNDDASAGQIGEYQSVTVASGSAVALTNNVAANVVSLSLTAGDWDLFAVVNLSPAASTALGFLEASTGTTSATRNLGERDRAFFSYPTGANVVGTNPVSVTPPTKRVSLAATTTIYLVVYAAFSVSTLSAWGSLQARRVR